MEAKTLARKINEAKAAFQSAHDNFEVDKCAVDRNDQQLKRVQSKIDAMEGALRAGCLPDVASLRVCQRVMWSRLAALGPCAGVLACDVHGPEQELLLVRRVPLCAAALVLLTNPTAQ